MKKIDKDLVILAIIFAIGLVGFLYNNSANGIGIAVAIVLFVVGLILLIKGGDWFVDGATAIAAKFHVPELLIGATVVSIGTTLPEVMVSAQASLKGNGAMSYGNAIGSIICNVSLIAAITLAIKPAKVEKKSLRIPVLFFFAAFAFYAYSAYFVKEYSRMTGLILLSIFVIYMIVLIVQTVMNIRNNKTSGSASEKIDAESANTMSMIKALILLVFGAAIITFGATLLVDNGTIIAKTIGVPDSVIALTIVALGTSLPELVTAITSLVKGHGALSVGNIIGANIFNLVLVSGIAITLKPFNLPSEKLIAGHNASLIVDLPVAAGVMLILTLPALIKGKLSRWQGFLLLLVYAGFCVFQFAF